MATLILVHGGFQSPAFFTPLASYLLRSGHRVLIPELPSSGTTPALPSFEADVHVVEDAVKGEIEARRDVILVMHGYGGVVGCEALKPLHGRNIETELGRVRKVVFLAGTILPIGHSTWPEDKPMPAGLELADGLITVKDAAKRFFNDIPSEAQEFWMSKLRPQSLAAYASPLSYPAHQHYNSAYLFCTLDRAMPLHEQEKMVGKAKVKETATIPTGHMPHISDPGAVAKFIERCAGLMECKL